MRNHFYVSYYGNKRNEMNKIYDYINFENIDTVVEPYCGSCAISFHIWLKHPNLKFILNDKDVYLFEMFNIIRDDDKLNEFENKINEELRPILLNDKKAYVEFVKQDNIYSWYFSRKYYGIRHGTFPTQKTKESKIVDCPIINFFRNADIEFHTMDGVDFYKNYKDGENNLILLDPPYLNSDNCFYREPKNNIYEYLCNNNIDLEKAKIYLILEKNWIIELLFRNNEKIEYDKKYETTKKKTKHLVIKQNCN